MPCPKNDMAYLYRAKNMKENMKESNLLNVAIAQMSPIWLNKEATKLYLNRERQSIINLDMKHE